MNILHVNFTDIYGGAALAAYRLHKSFLNQQVKSRILVIYKNTLDEEIIGPQNLLKKAVTRLGSNLESKLTRVLGGKTHGLFSPAIVSAVDIARFLASGPADVLNLHWTCRGMLRVEDFQKIKKPIIWTLHDMWAFTGGCHCDEGCEKYQEYCGNCPILSKRGTNDLSNRVLNRKIEAYANLNLTVVAPSQWLADKARKSTLFRNRRIQVIRNGLDLATFSPLNQRRARQSLNLPTNRVLILFGAMGATINPGKGYDLLISGLTFLRERWGKVADLVVFGSDGSDVIRSAGFKTHFMGHVDDESEISRLYSAANVMVVPSRQENLPFTISESLACGTPVVAFRIGGVPEMIEHGISGYLADPFDPKDLAHGIEFVLKRESINTDMSKAARRLAIQKFSLESMSEKYLALYKTIANS